MKNQKKFRYLFCLFALFYACAIHAQTVYINTNSTKYHSETCSQVVRGRSKTSEEIAKMNGYFPCSECHQRKTNNKQRENVVESALTDNSKETKFSTKKLDPK